LIEVRAFSIRNQEPWGEKGRGYIYPLYRVTSFTLGQLLKIGTKSLLREFMEVFPKD